MTELLDALDDPQFRHAAMVHLPIALSVIGFAFTLLVGLLAWKVESLRWIAIALFIALAVSAKFAADSGEDADAASGAVPAEAVEVLEEHQQMGEKVWYSAAAIGLILLVSAVPKKPVRVVATITGIVGSGALALWVANTAHLGGRLVYDFGVGTPGGAVATVSDDPNGGGGEEVGEEGTPDDAPAPDADPKVAFFEASVRPILEASCLKCHNAVRVKGGLDQTTPEAFLAGGDSGPAVVPGDSAASLLIARVTAEDELDLMPPDEDNRLAPEEIEILRRWIDEGAVMAPIGDS